MPQIGSTWSSADGKIFVVNGIRVVEGNTWIDYQRKDSDHEYTCFVEAFTYRYTETPNGT